MKEWFLGILLVISLFVMVGAMVGCIVQGIAIEDECALLGYTDGMVVRGNRFSTMTVL